jgi:hypothetical protein
MHTILKDYGAAQPRYTLFKDSVTGGILKEATSHLTTANDITSASEENEGTRR